MSPPSFVSLVRRSCISILMFVSCKTSMEPVAPESILEFFPTREGERLLLYPIGDAESLLGRPVSMQNGRLTIADAPLSTCIVAPHIEASTYSTKYFQGLGTTGSLSMQAERIAKLSGSKARATIVAVDVRNTHIIRADVRGECGDEYITAVKVGAGRRFFLRSRTGGLDAAGEFESIKIAAGVGRWENVEDSIEWSEAQAYAIELGAEQNTAGLELSASMPEQLADGESYQLKVSAGRRAWLVVMHQETDGKVTILLPSEHHPELVVPAGETLTLPTLRAYLRPGSILASEKITIIGFEDRASFDRFRPSAGRLEPAKAKEYAESLHESLAGVPKRRWDVKEIYFEIRSRASRSSQ